MSTSPSYRGRMDDLQAAAERWSLTLGEPYEQGAAGLHDPRDARRTAHPSCSSSSIRTARASTRPTRCELWDGDGAVRLLARDETGDALLLERCEPGTPLSAARCRTPRSTS